MAEYSLGDLIVSVGAEISGFSAAMQDVGGQLAKIGETADTALSHFDGLFEGLGEIAAAAGITTGTFEVVKDAIENFSKSEDVQTSFKLLTGSADEATLAFEGLKETAINLAVPFESLVGVAQKLAPQFGVGTDALKQVVTAAADAAAATGRSFDTIAEGLDRIAITGQVSTRQMVQFGVSMSDIATAMGVSTEQAIQLLKKGGQDAQADVDAVVTAIENKFGGAAEKIGQNLSGQFTKLKDELAFISEDLGKALAPLAGDLIEGLKDVEPAIKAIIDDGVKPFVAEVQSLFAEIKDGMASIGETLSSGDTLAGGKASGWIADSIAQIKSLTAEYAALDVEIKTLGENITSLGEQTGVAAMFQASDSAVVHYLGSLVSLKGAFDLLFPEFKQLTDLLQVLNFAIDSYQGKVAEMKNGYDALTKALQASTAAADPWNTEAMKIAESQLAADKAARSHAAGLDALSLAFKDLGVKVPPTQAEIDKLANAMTYIQQQFDAGKISSQTYGAAVDDFVKKMNSLQGAFVAAYEPVDELGQALKLAGISNTLNDLQKLTEAVAAAGAGYDRGRISASDYAAAIDKLNAFTLKNAVDGLAALQVQFSIAGEQYATGKIGIDEFSKALDAVLQATPAFQDAINKQDDAIGHLLVSMTSVTETTPNVAQILRSFGVETADDVAGHIKRLQDALDSANAAMKVGVPDAALAAQLALQALRQEQEKLSGEKLDDTILGIPSLTDLQSKLHDVTAAYEDLSDKGLLNATTALEGQIAQQRLEVQIAQQQGQNATDLQIKLDQTTSALHRQRDAWFEVYKALNSVVTGDITTAFDDIVFHFDKVGADFKKLGEDIVDTVLNGIIKQALTPLIESMDHLIVEGATWLANLLGLGSGGGVLGTSVGSAGGVAAITGNTTALSANTSALAALTSAIGSQTGVSAASGAGGAVGGVGSALGSVASVLTNFVAPISAAISAVTGVISIFQNMHQETSLNAIESNTRVGALYTLAAVQTLQDIVHFNNASLFPEVAGINQMLMDFVNGKSAFGASLAAAIAPPKGPDYSEYNANTLSALHNDLTDLMSFNWGTLAPGLGIIEGKLDVLNQSVVTSAGNGSTGTFVVNGITQTVSKVGGGSPTQASASQPAVSIDTIRPFLDAISSGDNIIQSSLNNILSAVNHGTDWLTEIYKSFNAGISAIQPRLDQMLRFMSQGPSVSVTVQGNIIGNTDFINEIANAVAAQIRAQGAYA